MWQQKCSVSFWYYLIKYCKSIILQVQANRLLLEWQPHWTSRKRFCRKCDKHVFYRGSSVEFVKEMMLPFHHRNSHIWYQPDESFFSFFPFLFLFLNYMISFVSFLSSFFFSKCAVWYKSEFSQNPPIKSSSVEFQEQCLNESSDGNEVCIYYQLKHCFLHRYEWIFILNKSEPASNIKVKKTSIIGKMGITSLLPFISHE